MATAYCITDKSYKMNSHEQNNNTEAKDANLNYSSFTNSTFDDQDTENLKMMSNEYCDTDNLSEINSQEQNGNTQAKDANLNYSSFTNLTFDDQDTENLKMMSNEYCDTDNNTEAKDANLNYSSFTNSTFDVQDIENLKMMSNEYCNTDNLSEMNSQEQNNDIKMKDEEHNVYFSTNYEPLSEVEVISENFDDRLNKMESEEFLENAFNRKDSTKKISNEKEKSLETTLNQQSIKTMDNLKEETLTNSGEIIDKINSQDVLTVLCDEILENSQNETLDEGIGSVVSGNELDVDHSKNKTFQNWSMTYDEKQFNEKINPMLSVFGLICFSFNSGPYEFTLTNMSHYIKGDCDANNDWLNNLDLYVQSLHITDLYVIGTTQKSLIHKYVHSAQIKLISYAFIPNIKTKCRVCHRYGCSAFKATSILHTNFKYDFKIPCTFKRTH